jgi:ribonuclease D
VTEAREEPGTESVDLRAVVPSRSLVGGRPLAWIDGETKDDVRTAMLDTLRAEPRLALDVEADSFYRYRESLCLLQVSGRRHDFLVDPLRGGVTPALLALLSDPARTIVVHGGESDVILLDRALGVRLGRLFDTHLAARFLGEPRVGLKALLEAHLGVAIAKDEQRSDWGRRPLSETQRAYARDDTAFLLALADSFTARLDAVGRRAWVEAECEAVRQRSAPPKVFDPEGWRSLKGARDLPDRAQRVLRAAFNWRERVAEATDRAPFRVATPERLLALARDVAEAPDRAGALARRGSWPSGVDLDALVDVLRAGLGTPVPPKPRERGAKPSPPTETQKRRVERLKALRDRRAVELGIEGSLVLTSAQIEAAARAPTTETISAEVGGWRWALLGREIEDTLGVADGA